MYSVYSQLHGYPSYVNHHPTAPDLSQNNLSPEHAGALAFGTSAGLAAGFATKSPRAGLIYGTIFTAGECATCHWMQWMAEIYVKNQIDLAPPLPQSILDSLLEPIPEPPEPNSCP